MLNKVVIVLVLFGLLVNARLMESDLSSEDNSLTEILKFISKTNDVRAGKPQRVRRNSHCFNICQSRTFNCQRKIGWCLRVEYAVMKQIIDNIRS